MKEINGRVYPMWSQFCDGRFVGSKMFEIDNMMGQSEETTITKVELVPNGDDSAMICFRGEKFDLCGDVKYIGVGASPVDGFIQISTRWGTDFYIGSANDIGADRTPAQDVARSGEEFSTGR